MKVSDEFVLRQVADEFLLIPIGADALRISGMISLTESGYLLYQQLQSGCDRDELLRVLLETYDVEAAEAAADVDAFLDKMRKLRILEDES